MSLNWVPHSDILRSRFFVQPVVLLHFTKLEFFFLTLKQLSKLPASGLLLDIDIQLKLCKRIWKVRFTTSNFPDPFLGPFEKHSS